MLDYDGDLWQVEYLEEDGMFALISEGIVENFSNMNSKWFEVIRKYTRKSRIAGGKR